MSEFVTRYPLLEPGCGITVFSMEGGEINFLGNRVDIKTKIRDCYDKIEDGLEYLTADDQTTRNLKVGLSVTGALAFVAGIAFIGVFSFSLPVLLPVGLVAGGAAIYSGTYTGISFAEDRIGGYCTSKEEYNMGLMENVMAGAWTGVVICDIIQCPPAAAFIFSEGTTSGGVAAVEVASETATATLVQYFPQISQAVTLTALLFQEMQMALNLATGKDVEVAPEENEGVNIEGGESSSDFSTANSYGIDMDNLNFSNTVMNHTGRPYQDSKLLINEIIESEPPVPDPRGTNALSWTVEGTFNGSTGYFELIIDPETNTVWHFVFKSY